MDIKVFSCDKQQNFTYGAFFIDPHNPGKTSTRLAFEKKEEEEGTYNENNWIINWTQTQKIYNINRSMYVHWETYISSKKLESTYITQRKDEKKKIVYTFRITKIGWRRVKHTHTNDFFFHKMMKSS